MGSALRTRVAICLSLVTAPFGDIDLQHGRRSGGRHLDCRDLLDAEKGSVY